MKPEEKDIKKLINLEIINSEGKGKPYTTFSNKVGDMVGNLTRFNNIK